MKQLKIFVAFVAMGFMGGYLDKGTLVPKGVSSAILTVAACGILYYLAIFPFVWLFTRAGSKSKATAKGSDHAVNPGTASAKADNPKDEVASAAVENSPQAASAGGGNTYLGKSYTRIHNVRFLKWDGGEGDYIDRIDAKYNITVLENPETSDLLAFSNLTQRLHTGESFSDTVEASLGGAEPGLKSLYRGLAVSAKEEDEDGMYEYMKANGGKLEFARGTEIPTDLSNSGFACVFSTAVVDEAVLCSAGKIPEIRIDGKDVAPIPECHGYIDDGGDRVAAFVEGSL